MHFDLITWPGYLCYTGDMGTYVFRRLEDMFEFFRTDRRDDSSLNINRHYWSEKLQAVDGNRHNGSAMQFSADKFRRVISEIRLEWIRDARDTLSKEQRRELWEAVDEEILQVLGDDDQGYAAQIAARDFYWSADGMSSRYRHGKRGWEFHDLWEYSFNDYTHRFTWCCYALAWGIKQYDEAKVPA